MGGYNRFSKQAGLSNVKVDINAELGLDSLPIMKQINNRVYFCRVPLLAVANANEEVMFPTLNGRRIKPNLNITVVRGLTLKKLIEIYQNGYGIGAIDKQTVKDLIEHLNVYLDAMPRMRNIPNMNRFQQKLLDDIEEFGREILENQSHYLSTLVVARRDLAKDFGFVNMDRDEVFDNNDVVISTPSDEFEQKIAEMREETDAPVVTTDVKTPTIKTRWNR
jgi:hypothetical protein